MKLPLIVPILFTSLCLAQNSLPRNQAPPRATPAARPDPNAEPETVPLWANGAPGALGTADDDKPTITIFRTTLRPNGTAVIVAPGGGYARLSMNNEAGRWPHGSTRWA